METTNETGRSDAAAYRRLVATWREAAEMQGNGPYGIAARSAAAVDLTEMLGRGALEDLERGLRHYSRALDMSPGISRDDVLSAAALVFEGQHLAPAIRFETVCAQAVVDLDPFRFRFAEAAVDSVTSFEESWSRMVKRNAEDEDFVPSGMREMHSDLIIANNTGCENAQGVQQAAQAAASAGERLGALVLAVRKGHSRDM